MPDKIDPQSAYILLIEDNLQNTVLISRLLDHLKVAAYEWKASGWQVEEVLTRLPRLDLILLDLHLPREDGYAVLANIRSNPRFAETRVVAVTADANPQTMAQARQAGFDGFLGKPINPSKFTQQITDILAGKPIWETQSFD